MIGKRAVFLIKNKYNKKCYVGISHDADNEWTNIQKDMKIGLGIRKMKEDYEAFGPDAFDYEVMLESEIDNELHRKESEIAHKFKTWVKGYNSLPLLNYSEMTEERLAFEKLRMFKVLEDMEDGKYMFMDLLDMLGLSENDLQVLLKEMTLDEMKYFRKHVILRNRNGGLEDIYVQVKSF